MVYDPRGVPHPGRHPECAAGLIVVRVNARRNGDGDVAVESAESDSAGAARRGNRWVALCQPEMRFVSRKSLAVRIAINARPSAPAPPPGPARDAARGTPARGSALFLFFETSPFSFYKSSAPSFSFALATRRSCVSTKCDTYDVVIRCLGWSAIPLFPKGTVDFWRRVLFTVDKARTSAARVSENSCPIEKKVSVGMTRVYPVLVVRKQSWYSPPGMRLSGRNPSRTQDEYVAMYGQQSPALEVKSGRRSAFSGKVPYRTRGRKRASRSRALAKLAVFSIQSSFC